jgi:uncharacterized protein (DUF1800 family)
MKLTRRSASACLLASLVARPSWAASSLEADAAHAVNRLSFGLAPGDLERVTRGGIDRYVEEQLAPERLPLPASMTRQLELLSTTRLPQRELIQAFRDAGQAARNDSEEGKAQRRELYERVTLEAGEARLLRALQSPRQLYEVMVDFWFNHFNVFIGKGLDRVLVENYEREAIRPHALGRFQDLLKATAHHPAMLFYLDNWLSVAPGYQPARGAGALQKSSGLNENYARELMELHTLGVDGGYSQADVTELARMLTGWTINPRRTTGNSVFFFDAQRHDAGAKQWLGRQIAPAGQGEGERALEVLATHPATARHISYKLAQYFVADAPPAALVDQLGARFLASGGDIRAVLAALFASPAFRDPAVHRVKFKTPYRYLLSAVRAADLTLTNVRPLLATAYQLGMPLYGCQTPDGYKNTEEAWLNPDAITRRINFATAFASGRLPLARPMEDLLQDGDKAGPRQAGKFNPAWATPPVNAEQLLATLGSTLSTRTRETVAQSEPGLRAALLLGSPDFMRH